MPAQPTWSYRKFGPAASTIRLSIKGGAVIAGVWISAKGTSPLIRVFDSASASPAAATAAVGSTVPAAVGLLDLKGLEMGTGLVVANTSCTGTIIYRPAQTP